MQQENEVIARVGCCRRIGCTSGVYGQLAVNSNTCPNLGHKLCYQGTSSGDHGGDTLGNSNAYISAAPDFHAQANACARFNSYTNPHTNADSDARLG